MAGTAPSLDPVARPAEEPLYRYLLGPQWNNLHVSLQAFHGTASTRQGHGAFEIRHGKNPLARLLAWLAGFPRAGQEVPADLHVTCVPNPHEPNRRAANSSSEIWERTFGGRKLVSVQWAEEPSILVERFGLMEFRLQLTVQNGCLCFRPAGTAIVIAGLPIDLPEWLSPWIEADVAGAPGRAHCFCPSVKLEFPLIGLLMSYRGIIKPIEAER